MLDEEQRRALLDHELLHCDYDPETETASIAAHDFEGFVKELERHGAWQADLQQLQQTSLFDR